MKKIEQKIYRVSAFKACLKVQLSSIYKDESIVNEKLRHIEFMLENDYDVLTAKTFFAVMQALELDLKVICHQFFENITATRLKSSKKELDQLFGVFFNTKRDLAEATGINESTINKLFNKNLDGIYAYQVCALAIAFGLEPYILFEHFYGNKKKKFVVHVELVDSEETENVDELLVVDQETVTTTFGRDIKTRTTTLRKHQHTTFDYIVQHTDYFLTPRTSVEIMKDFKKFYNINITPSNIYGYLHKHIDNGLTKTKIDVLTSNGSISKKPQVTFIKTKQTHAQHHKPEDQAIKQMLKQHAAEVLEMNKANEQEETDAVNQLYAVIAANPGTRPSFFLTIFDIKAKVLERRLQKLQNEGKIEYRNKGKSGGYWLVNKED